MSNRNYNTQTNPNRQKLMDGGRAKKMGGGMMRRDMQSGYYPSDMGMACLLYTSPSPRDGLLSRMPSSA